MKKTQLERGNEIQSEIRQLNEQLEKWQQADKFKRTSFVNLSTADDYKNIQVSSDYINFNEMKAAAITTIKNLLSALENEFASL